jgi:two-component system, cell cycle sensor histidine kinase and response regulator CckA
MPVLTTPLSWSHNRIALPVVLLGGTLLSLTGYALMRQAELRRMDQEFQHRVFIRNALTSEVLNGYNLRLYGLRHLFVGPDEVTLEEFMSVAREVRGRMAGISALQWVPVVPREERPAVEAAMSARLGRPFFFTRLDGRGGLEPSPDHAKHLPILYLEPVAGNKPAWGLDLSFGPTRDALARAARSREMTTSRRIKLVQDQTPERAGIIFIWPVYRPDDTRLLGYVQGVFHLRTLFEASFLLQPDTAVEVLYLDAETTDPAERLLYARFAQFPLGGEDPAWEDEFRAGRHRELSLRIADRQWRALYRPRADWWRAQRRHEPEYALASGMFITALMGLVVNLLRRRTDVAEREVSSRTAALDLSRGLVEGVLRALPGMVYHCRYDGRMRPTYISEGAQALTGHPPEALRRGQVRLTTLVHPEDLPRVRRATREALEAGRPFEIEYRLRQAGGTERVVFSRGHGLYEGGKLTGMEGLLVDISSFKAAEEEKMGLQRRLAERQKLESLGLLAGGVAHDFNNLLTGVMANASLARLEVAEDSTAAQAMRRIESAAQHAADMCRQMLAFAGKTHLEMTRVDLNQLIQDLLPLLGPSIAERATLDLALAAELPPVRADTSQLRQVMMNFVINAGDACRPGHGRIRIATRLADFTRAELAATRCGGDLAAGTYVEVVVADNGEGMSAKTLARIFDPFFTTKPKGRGLGLAAVAGMVQSHGGGLFVQSEPGGGTTFRLLLPPLTAAG